MNVNRLLGIFIASTLLIWILIFALSPQPKYQKINNIKIPELEEPSVNIQEFNKIEFEEVKKNALKLDIKDDLPSAKDRVAKIDFNLYVYKVGAFRSSATISNIVKSYKNPLKNVKTDIKEKLLKEKSNKIIDQKITEIEDEIMILDNISDFSKKFPFAKIEKLPAINSNMVSDKGQKINNNNISQIIEDIFFLDQGQFSEINKSDEKNLYYIAFIEEIIEEKQKTLKEVENDIKKEVTLIKKSELLTEKSQEIANKLKDNPEKINQISKEYKAKLLRNITIKRDSTSYPAHFVTNIFDLKKNNISNAIKISDKEYYIAIIHKINLPNIDKIPEKKLAEIESQYKNDISSDLWNKLEKYLNKKYKVINK